VENLFFVRADQGFPNCGPQAGAKRRKKNQFSSQGEKSLFSLLKKGTIIVKNQNKAVLSLNKKGGSSEWSVGNHELQKLTVA
jgi:hypothetical protein